MSSDLASAGKSVYGQDKVLSFSLKEISKCVQMEI